MISSEQGKMVFPTREYQESALDDYIKSGLTVPKKYIFGSIQFVIQSNRNYDDFYTFVKDDNTKYILSRNEEKLKGFCGYINRITM
jgi:hypothetical protein